MRALYIVCEALAKPGIWAMKPHDLGHAMRQDSPKPPRTVAPDYVLAAVLIWSLILYGLLVPRTPAAVRLAARSLPVCVR
jgi:hypothetical protein